MVERLIRSRYPILLLIAASIVARVYVLPFRSVPVTRSDGAVVLVPNPHMTGSKWDVWDYLSEARNLARGHGFTSRLTYPPFLPESLDESEGETDAFPVLWRQPAYPLLVAGLFGLLGREDPNALLLLQALAVLLLPLAAYAFARRILTDGWAALAAFWALSTPAVIGFHEPLVATTLYVTGVCVVWSLATKPGAWMVGAALGIAYYVRVEAVFLLPAVLIARRVALGVSFGNVLTTMLVFALLVLPWWVRTAVLTGDAGYNAASLLYHDVGPFPGWLASRTMAVRELTPWAFVVDHAGDVLFKTVRNGARFARDVCLFPAPGLLLLAVLALKGDRTSRGWAVGALLLPAVTFLLLAPLEYAPRFVAASVPALAVSAAVVLARMGRRGKWLAFAFSVASVLTTSLFVVSRPVGDPRSVTEVASVDARELTDRITVSNVHTVVAWVWDRPAVWAPPAPDVAWLRERRDVVAVFTCGTDRSEADEAILEAYARELGASVSPGCPSIAAWHPPRGDAGR